jgi:hypothetical protein
VRSKGSGQLAALVLTTILLAGCSSVGTAGAPSTEPLASSTPAPTAPLDETAPTVATPDPTPVTSPPQTPEPTLEPSFEPTSEPQATTLPCPVESPVSIIEVNYARLKCFGDAEIRVRAWLDRGPITGWLPPTIEPAWLPYPAAGPDNRAWALWWKPPKDTDIVWCEPYCEFQWIHLRPDSTLQVQGPPRWVIAIGHLNDPAAERCHWEYAPDQEHTEDDADAVATCRRAFVLTALEDAPPP